MARAARKIDLKELLVVKTGLEIPGHAQALVRGDAVHAKTVRYTAALQSAGIETRTKSSLKNTVHSVCMISGESEVIEQTRRINLLPDVQIKKTHAMKTELACFLIQKQYQNLVGMEFSAHSVKLEDYRSTHERIGRAISKMSYRSGVFEKLGIKVLFRVTEAKFHRLKDGSIRVHVHCHLVVLLQPRKNFEKRLRALRDAAGAYGLKKYVRFDRIGGDDKNIEMAVGYLFNPLKSEVDEELKDGEIVEFYKQSLGLKFFVRLGQFAKFSKSLKPVVETISVPVDDHFTGVARTLTKNIVKRHGLRVVKMQKGEYLFVRRGVRTMAPFAGTLWNDGDDDGPRQEKLIAIAPPSATRTSPFARPKMIVLNYGGNISELVDKCGANEIFEEVLNRWNRIHPNDAVEIAPASAKPSLPRLPRSGISVFSPFSPNHGTTEDKKRRHYHLRGLSGDLKAQRQALRSWVADFEAAGQMALDKLDKLEARGNEGMRIGGVEGLTISLQAHVELTKLKAKIADVASQSDLVLNGRDFWRGGLRPRESRRAS